MHFRSLSLCDRDVGKLSLRPSFVRKCKKYKIDDVKFEDGKLVNPFFQKDATIERENLEHRGVVSRRLVFRSITVFRSSGATGRRCNRCRDAELPRTDLGCRLRPRCLIYGGASSSRYPRLTFSFHLVTQGFSRGGIVRPRRVVQHHRFRITIYSLISVAVATRISTV